MGTWSADILGSDDALDTLGYLEDILNSDDKIDLYPLPAREEIILRVRSLLELNSDKIMTRRWEDSSWPVIAAVYMATGAVIPLTMVSKIKYACYTELKELETNAIGWSHPEERIAVLQQFLELIDSHVPGKITRIEHIGLLQKISQSIDG